MIPEVSIIILAYNTEKYIAKAIESALIQTEKNIELIVVDDASSDDTLKVINSFTDKRIKLLVNEVNLGQNISTNLAIKQAKGKWITRLDSDDWYSSNRLDKLLKLAVEKDVDMIADDIYFIEDGKTFPWSTLLGQSKLTIKENIIVEPIFFVKNDLPGMWGLPLGLTRPLIKRDFLVKNNIYNYENIVIAGDFWFYLTCLAHGAKFLFVPKPDYFYRSRHNSLITINKVKRIEAYCQATQFFLGQDFIKNDSQLLAALQKRLILIEKTRPYFIVVDYLKKSDYFNAIKKMLANPYFFYHLLTQTPRIIYRRLFIYFNKISIDSIDSNIRLES